MSFIVIEFGPGQSNPCIAVNEAGEVNCHETISAALDIAHECQEAKVVCIALPGDAFFDLHCMIDFLCSNSTFSRSEAMQRFNHYMEHYKKQYEC